MRACRPTRANSLKARQDDIVAGRRHPFGGRIVDNEGRERLGNHAALGKMDFYVEGARASCRASEAWYLGGSEDGP